MALKLYDRLTPSGDFPLVDASDVEIPGGGRLDNLLAEAQEETLTSTTVNGFAAEPSFNNMYVAMISATPLKHPLVAGETYLVQWDDTVVTATAYNGTVPGYGAGVAIGNGSLLGYPSNNEPFIICMDADSPYILIGATDGSQAESHAVSIVRQTVKINESYLPEDWVKSYVEQYIDEALGGEY